MGIFFGILILLLLTQKSGATTTSPGVATVSASGQPVAVKPPVVANPILANPGGTANPFATIFDVGPVKSQGNAGSTVVLGDPALSSTVAATPTPAKPIGPVYTTNQAPTTLTAGLLPAAASQVDNPETAAPGSLPAVGAQLADSSGWNSAFVGTGSGVGQEFLWSNAAGQSFIGNASGVRLA